MGLLDFLDSRKRLERAAAREVARAKNTVLNWIAPDSYAETADYYQVSGRVTRSLLVYDKPGKAKAGWEGWLASLLLCDGGPKTPGSVRLHVSWQPFSPLGAGLKLGMAETGHRATLDLLAKRGTLPDRKLKNAIRDVDRVQQMLTDAEGALLSVCVIVTCESETQEGCDAVWRQVIGKLNQRLLHWRPLDDRHAMAFGQQTLGGSRSVWHPLSWDTATLAFSWPCIGDSVDMGVGPVWGTNVSTALPVQYDPFDLAHGGPPAPHVCIIGPTGNGKSVAFFTVVAEYLTALRPPRIRIIDPKGDYLLACEKLNGTLIAFSQKASVTINCFDIAAARWVETEDGPQPEINVVYEGMQNVLGCVRLMVASSGAAFDPEMGSVLQTAILRAYGQNGIDPEDHRTWDKTATEMPTLETLWRILVVMSKEEEAPEMARRLAVLIRPFATGMWSRLFSRHTTANLSNPFVVYDVRGLTPDLRPVAIHLITAMTWRETRRNPRPTIFGMDEVTELLSYKESGKLVSEVYLKGRSAGLAAWSMAQRPEHYLATQEGRDALSMAHTVLLLKQDDNDAIDAAAGRFKITPGQRRDLASAGIGQALLCTTGRGNVFLNIDPSPVVLDWLPKPVKAEEAAAEQVTGLV